jgi:hypothetical protein
MAPPRPPAILGLTVLLLLAGCGGPRAGHRTTPWSSTPVSSTTAATEAEVELTLELSEGIYPCSECHADLETDPERRELSFMHEEIELRHDEEHRWCLDCHDADNRDRLRLASGTLVPFEESYRLCGQCHGDKYRDWRAGVHGRRTGAWNGHKRYLLCAHCHDPHRPRFEPQAPEPPPRRPEPRWWYEANDTHTD